jgi:archaeal flagellar protein FlaI
MSEIDLKKILAPDSPEPSQDSPEQSSTTDEHSGEDALMRMLSEKKSSSEKLIESYGNVDIVDTGEQLYLYRVRLPHLTPSDSTVIESIQRVATKIIDVRKESINSRIRKKGLYDKLYEMISKTKSINVGENKMRAYADIISREMGGYGLLDYLMDDEQLEEVMVVPPERKVFVFHRKHGMLLSNIQIDEDEYILNVVERIARDVSRRVDTNTPLLDARLPSGDRVNATLNPASVDGPSLTIRKFREDPYTIIDMINFKTINPEAAAFLWLAAEGMQVRPSNILISGGTSSGKTTFLNCISMFIRPTDRVLTIEDTAELRLPLDHWVRLETRPPSIEGTGEISMDVLLKNSLRMRPDRIVVGEVRHDEAFTLFTAMNTGHQGSMGTIHANTSDETLVRLMSPPMSVPEQMATALDLIVVLNRINVPNKGLARRVTEIAEISGSRKPEIHLLYEWDSEKDSLIRIDDNSIVQKKIRKFSGLSDNKVKDELDLRAELLTEAAKKGVNSIEKFSVFVAKYYERQG